MTPKEKYFEDDPLWYKDAIIYELHIKSFFDKNEDGMGDFQGLIEKLDYLEGLGVTAIWLLPFYPSPLRDDGYDIADYFNINPDYGTLQDFRDFLREAHRRGMRVITELVLNHTSDQHEWFQRSRVAKPGTAWRNYYVWSDEADKYHDARIIFLDFESSNWTWDPVAKAHFWHRFYSHQPDLNFENPQVQRAMFRVIDFWFSLGVDGLRLDAVPYLYEREGTNCENLPETYAFLRELREYVNRKYKNKMLLAEANQWPEDAVTYFGDGDSCHMAFHFPLMPRIFMALQMEDRFPIMDILDQTPAIHPTCQWALFLRNHDELTLEMVTDEERDYMYRVYARDPRARINLGIRRRLAPLVDNNRRRVELMNILLFSLPGTPIVYYGDEIGMGDNYYLGDRNGVRTPMQWNSDRNAGFSKTNPHRLYLPVVIDPEYQYEALNVENQERNPSSLLWWMRRIIGMRKRFKAFGRGDLEFIPSDNPKVLCFVRRYEDECILVVVNLSRFSQAVALDLSRFTGHTPVEVFSRNRFPVIREAPYVLTLSFHDYFWFQLEAAPEAISVQEAVIPALSVRKNWANVLDGKGKERLETEILPRYFMQSRWFRGKARIMRTLRITERILLDGADSGAQLVFVEVNYTEGSAETYLLPLSHASGDKAWQISDDFPKAVIARLSVDEDEGILFDAVFDEDFRRRLLHMIGKRQRVRGRNGDLSAYPGRIFRNLLGGKNLNLPSQVVRAEQSNTSILYENTLFLKLYRHLEEGMNPDSEIIRFLTERTRFKNIPLFAGSLEYQRQKAEPMVIGQLQGYVPNQGDTWTYTLDAVGQYFERVLSEKKNHAEAPEVPSSLFDIYFPSIPPHIQELIGGVYLEMVILLGKRTGELHSSLSSAKGDRAFDPEPFTMLYQRSVFQSMRALTKKVMQLLERGMKKMPDETRKQAASILSSEPKIIGRFQRILEKKFPVTKTRFHGDFHLGQALYTGKDFILIDFEGEPARALSERRLKRSPLRDVAGMIRSFHYAVHSSLLQQLAVRQVDVAFLEKWADLWYHYISGIFLTSYLHAAGKAPFIPEDREDLETMLQCFLLEKAVYELGYELNNRPDWVVIPMKGIKHILKNV